MFIVSTVMLATPKIFISIEFSYLSHCLYPLKHKIYMITSCLADIDIESILLITPESTATVVAILSPPGISIYLCDVVYDGQSRLADQFHAG
jgi:hypothetical protein